MFELPCAVPRASLYAELGVAPNATAQEIADARIRVIQQLQSTQRALLNEAATSEPTGPAERALAMRAVEDRMKQLNAIQLESPEERLRYDRQNPPFELLRDDDAEEGLPWTDAAALLTRIREVVAEFVTARGEPFFHPSDLTRSDFSSDFMPCEDLDGAETC